MNNTASVQTMRKNHPEAADIFETAMKNNFTVGSAVIDAILAGDWQP